MTKGIPIVTDTFVDKFQTNFEVDYQQLYKFQNKGKLIEIMDQEITRLSDKQYKYQPLRLPENNEYEFAYENVVSLHKQLDITPVEAVDKRIWIALENSDFLDYHLRILKLLTGSDKEIVSSIQSRSTFKNGHKRSLAINNIASLWWMGHILYDDKNKEDPYHFVKEFTKTKFRGNFVVLSSSNVIGNSDVRLGMLDGIYELINSGKIQQKRKTFSEANKILNLIGSVQLLDLLSREEVKDLIITKLPIFLNSDV